MTPLQASILMCFNDSPKLTFEELVSRLWQKETNNRKQLTSSQQTTTGALHDMSLEEILRFAVQPLVYFKYKVISKEKDIDPKKRTN